MKKTLYSLMLSDEVVREVDALAHRLGTNRSNLINQILAEYVSVTTPERRISDIFRAVEDLISSSRDLVPFVAPNTQTMSLKSSLEYKYRPTVKYEVELYRGGGDALGALSVVFRPQSAALIQARTAVFRLWTRVEAAYLAPRLPPKLDYALYDGKFTRTIAAPVGRDCTPDDIAEALSDYIQIFDALMKGVVAGRLSPRDVEAAYAENLSQRRVLI